MIPTRHYCPSCGASLISEPDGSRGVPGATSCCKRCGWHLVTLEAWRKLTPFRQGYLLYMQGAWPTSEIMDQQNPYPEGSDEWGAFRQGQQHAMSDVQDSQSITDTVIALTSKEFNRG